MSCFFNHFKNFSSYENIGPPPCHGIISTHLFIRGSFGSRSSSNSILVITLICTRHAYLASGHLRFLLCQNTVEQLFLKTPFIKAQAPCSITAHVYMLADPRQPVYTYKSTEKGKLLTEHTALGKLTKPFGHAWPKIRPNT